MVGAIQPQDGGPLDGMGKEALFALANDKAASAESGMRSVVADAVAAGEALKAAKAQCPHGQWLDWLAEHWGYSERSARRYMQLAGSKDALQDAATVRDALRLLSTKEREAKRPRVAILDEPPEPEEPKRPRASHLNEDLADNEAEAEWELIDSQPADTVVESWKSSSNRLGDLKAIIDELEPHEVEVLKGWLDVLAKPKIRKSGYSDAFERFWAAFPGVRKTKKGGAYKAWKRADESEHEYIIQAAAEYADSPEGQGQYCSGPLPWLNGNRWEDDRSAWLNGGDSDNPNDVTRRTLAKVLGGNQQAIEGW